MPRLSVSGKAVMGVGGGSPAVSIDGAVPAAFVGSQGGGWDWLDDDTTIIGQTQIGAGWKLYKYVTSPAALTLVDNLGVNFITAGGGRYAVYLAGPGVRTNYSGLASLPNAGAGSIDKDGTFAVSTNAQQSSGISVYASTGALLQQINVVTTAGIIQVRDTLLTYPTAQGYPLVFAATNAAYPKYLQQAGVSRVIPMMAGAVAIVAEYRAASDSWSVRLATEQKGLIVSTAPVAGSPTPSFGMDARIVGGLVRFAWSTGAGDAASELVTLDVNTSTGTTVRGTVSGGGMVYTAGPTLEGQKFDMAQGAAGYPPKAHPIVETSRLGTKPWLDYFQNNSTSLTQLTTEVRKIPPPVDYGGADVLLTTPAAVFPLGRVVQDSATIVWDRSVPGVMRANVRASALPSPLPLPPNVVTGPPGPPGAGSGASVSSVSYVPVSTGAEPLVILSNGAGEVLLTPYTP